MADIILVLNAGSTSLKFGLFGTGDRKRSGEAADLVALSYGEIEGLDTAPHLTIRAGAAESLAERGWAAGTDLHVLLGDLLGWVETHHGAGRLAAAGHRVALGGLENTGPELVNAELRAKLKRLVPLAPMHQPRNIAPIEALAKIHPHLPQVACFDTAFHRTIPHVAQLYGLPRELTEAGARRYGFHGLSYEYISGRLADIDPAAAKGRTIIAHLGGGASMCALRNGKSVATTMGFSPLSGLLMATRPGELDAGIPLWLIEERGMSVEQIKHLLYHESGLKGVSGLSGDMRELLASHDPRAREAVDLFVYRILQEAGTLAAALEGLDVFVFTGGIGEHAASVRAEICKRLAWLGIRIDETANTRGELCIGAHDSPVAVFAIPTNEELMVARHTQTVLCGEEAPVRTAS
jgi:acetate kinase